MRPSGSSAFSPLSLFTYGVFIFVLSPIVVVLLASVTAAEYTSFPPQGLSLRWYAAIAGQREFIESFWISVQVAVIACLVATALGVLSALALVRYRFPGRDALSTLFLSPLMLPTVVLGLALLQFYAAVGITRTPFSLVLGHAILTTPYVIRLVSASLSGFDRALELAAQNLGASPFTAFRRVTLPIISPGVIAGAAFAFIVSFDDVSVSLFLSSPGVVTLPVRIFSYLEQHFDPVVTAVCSVLIVIAALLIFLIERTLGLGKLFGAERL